MSQSPFPAMPEQLTLRLALMRSLANSLQVAQTALLESNLAELQSQTIRQQSLCDQLQRLGPSPPTTNLRALESELAQIEWQVAKLNRTYAALLRRASRTVEIFCRVLDTSGVTYALPQPAIGERGEPCPVSMG